jgi:hypothetical protein
LIILLRARNKDGRVVAAEAYFHDEKPEDHRHPLERCRCIPSPTWQFRMTELKHENPGCKVTADPIYLSKVHVKD